MAGGGGLTALPRLEKLSPAVFRVLGGNPGPMCLQGTNAYLLGTGPRKLLLDTSEPGVPEFSANLRQALASFSPPASISAIICTHWHVDHVGAVPDALEVAAEVSQSEEEVKVWKYPRPAGKERPEVVAPAVYRPISDGQVFQAEGVTLKALYTPGHSDDHIVLLLQEEAALFSGDAVLGEGTTHFEDLHAYVRSLERMLEEDFRRIYPAHGPVVEDGPAKVREYIAHRLKREKDYLDVLHKAHPKPRTPEAIVDSVYTSIPENLKKVAEWNVKGHLGKLVKDGRVESHDDGSYGLTPQEAQRSKV